MKNLSLFWAINHFPLNELRDLAYLSGIDFRLIEDYLEEIETRSLPFDDSDEFEDDEN